MANIFQLTDVISTLQHKTKSWHKES